MENIVLGFLAHVDRGKTSLSESLIFESGEIRKKGRVDHGDSVLDHDDLERKKGITIYAKSVYFTRENKRFFLLDTPGHREFSGEMERALKVLDYGVLLLDAREGIGKREEELRDLIERERLPLFIFVNKMDLFQGERESILEELKTHFPKQNVLDFTAFPGLTLRTEEGNGGAPNKETESDMFSKEERELMESIALSSLESTEEYLESGKVSPERVRSLIRKASLIPVFFGSALKQEGIGQFLEALTVLCINPKAQAGQEEKRGYIYKITRDEKGRRVAKARLFTGRLTLREEWLPGEKLTELRLEEGEKYTELSEVEAGSLFTAPVSERISPGAFPFEKEKEAQEGSLFQVELSIQEGDILRYAEEIRDLSEEFPEWNLHIAEGGKKVRIRSLGALQRELLEDLFRKRTGQTAVFSPVELIYGEGPRKEAYGRAVIESPGHYFALSLRLFPSEEGQKSSGNTENAEEEKPGRIGFAENLNLRKDWMSRLETEWQAVEIKGPCLGGPYTHYGMEIIEADYRESSSYFTDLKAAVSEALFMAEKSAGLHLFQPCFSYSVSIKQTELGAVMQTIERAKGRQEELLQEGERVILKGRLSGENLPSLLGDLQRLQAEVGYRFSFFEKLTEEKEREILLERTGDSEQADKLLFGADESAQDFFPEEEEALEGHSVPREAKTKEGKKKKEKTGAYIQDIELEEIFLRTFGPVRNRGKEALLSEQKLILSREKEEKQRAAREQYEKKSTVSKKKLLLVDGYNFMFAKDALKELAKEDLMAGREKVIQYLSEYAVFYDTEVYLIFDAYHVKGNPGTKQRFGKNLELIFTKEGESADFTLTKMAKEFSEKGRAVSIVTSDQAVQVQAFSGKGVSRYSSREFYGILEEMRRQISEMEL